MAAALAGAVDFCRPTYPSDASFCISLEVSSGQRAVARAAKTPVECVQLRRRWFPAWLWKSAPGCAPCAGSAERSYKFRLGRLDVQIFSRTPRFERAPSECPLRKLADRINRLIGIRLLRDSQQRLSLHLRRNRHARDFQDGGSNVHQAGPGRHPLSRALVLWAISQQGNVNGFIVEKNCRGSLRHARPGSRHDRQQSRSAHRRTTCWLEAPQSTFPTAASAAATAAL